LPPQPVEPADRTIAATTVSSADKVRQVATVLIVDDTRVGRMLVDTVLKADGHQVIEAESGLEALEMLEQIRPDLIILDVRMPGMDGFELCAKIKANPEVRRIPVIFLSAACSLDERVKGLSVGGDDFIRKPFEGADLVARVKVHLQRAALLKSSAPPS
ncbi:MAG: response regulator, partial [Myxococcaceae bacterium]|nr:response regulator [Myxococcaceae bacterium]